MTLRKGKIEVRFVAVTQNYSHIMTQLRREGKRVLTCRGSRNEEGVSGYNLMLLEV